jgi:hypothetical protein
MTRPKKTPKGPKESVIQADILNYLFWLGVFAWRNYTGPIVRGGGGKRVVFCPNPSAGAPDILGVTEKGRLLAIEVKSSSGKLTSEQCFYRERLTTLGAIYITARSLDDVVGKIGEILNG